MKVIIKYVVFGFMFLLLSCGKNEKQDSNALTAGKGGRNFGGILKINETEFLKTLYPPSITDAFSYRIANQVYEGLFKFDPTTLELIPSIAESYSSNAEGTEYTIQLRKGVFFHDNACFTDEKGRELKAQDVAYCFRQLCINSATNQGYSIFKGVLLGADEIYEASLKGKTDLPLSGVEIVNDYAVKIKLTKPNSLFLYNLARPFAYIYPKEAVEKYGLDMRINPVGTGPFFLSSIDENVSVVLIKNPNYYGKDVHGNILPLINAVNIKFIQDKKTELLEFKKGNFDMIYRLPTESIIEILEEMESEKKGEYSQYVLQRTPEMNSQFLCFNTKSGVYSNKFLRKALSFAIDRNKILDFVLNGEGFGPGTNGICPPSFEKYKTEGIKGYTLNLDSARYFLKKAGFPNGKGLAKLSLQVNTDGERNLNVAIEVQKQLKENLNIELDIQTVPFAQLVENLTNGKADFFRIGWISDYPHPENFLSIFYGKGVPTTATVASFPNFTRYTNPAFDVLYEKAISASKEEETYALLKQAEQVLMNDAPVIVLWYDEAFRLLQPNVQNLPNNPMQYRDYSQTYFEKAAVEEKK